MRYRPITISSILLFLCGIVYLTCFYGPQKRSYVSASRIESVAMTADIGNLWKTAGVHGRVAVLFTRHLNAEVSPLDTVNSKFADLAMQHGIVRTIYHVLPDDVWQAVSGNLAQRLNVRAASSGFVMIKPEGRVYIQPLSQYKPTDEKKLVVVEPGVWSGTDRARIAELINSGSVRTDLITVIRGDMPELDIAQRVQPVSAK